jgi:5-methylcytosine-specific restriction protein B
MSRYCGELNSKPILEAAGHWRDQALLGEGSVFTTLKLWTVPLLEVLDRYFVQRPDLGDAKFLEKLEQQLAPADPAAKQLAAEMMWLMYLCPSSLTPNHKRQTVQTVWGWSGEPFPSDSQWMAEDRLTGIGSAGPGFNQNQWRELAFLINLVRRFRTLQVSEQQRLTSDGWAFDEWLEQIEDWETRQLRHMLLFLLFPDDFERIFGKNDRKAVVRHFTQRDPKDVNRMNAFQLDRELQAIRKRLEALRGTTELDYYVSPLKDEWKGETIAAATEGLTADHVRLALQEIDRVGTPSDAVSTGYDLVHAGKRYPPKLVLSLAVKHATGEPLDRAAFSSGDESSAFRRLRRLGFEIVPKATSSGEIAELLRRFCDQADEGTRLAVQDYLSEYRGLKVKVSFGQGNFARIPWVAFLGAGQTVSQGVYPVLLLFREERQLLLCYGISETNPPVVSWGDLGETVTVRQWFKQRYDRNPDRYGDSLVCAAYDARQPLPVDDLQRLLDQMIDRYHDVVNPTPKDPPPKVLPPILPVRVDLREAALAFAQALRGAGVTFGDRHHSVALTFVASLATKPLVILTGLSGSGKTQIAVRLGEWLGPGRLHAAAVRPDWTGAESLFGYEDGLKASVDGHAAWSVPGPLEFMLSAAADPQHPYLLLLDEMNLAHVERYFADVLSGMESGQPCLPNLRRGDDGSWRQRSNGPARIPFPRNLWIVGTVNVDETTYMFSPKVLDRANTFEFRVETGDLSGDVRKPQPCATGDPELVRGLLAVAKDDHWHLDHQVSFHAELAMWLRRLHEVLGRYNLEFGHRAFYEMLRFASLAHAAGLAELEPVLDRIMMQKVLPRLHGSRRRLELPLLALAHFCRDLPEVVAADEKLPLLNTEVAADIAAKLPTSHAKIGRMLRNLRANQFASFTE